MPIPRFRLAYLFFNLRFQKVKSGRDSIGRRSSNRHQSEIVEVTVALQLNQGE